MFDKNCIFYLVLLWCQIFSSNAHPSAEVSNIGDTTNYTVEVGFSKTTDEGMRHFIHCNGGLIDRNLILTLASCIMNETYHIQNPLVIQISSDGQVYMLLRNRLQAIYTPSTFNATTLQDDIAVLKLSAPLSTTKHFQTLEIPVKAVEVDGNAKMTTKSWLKYFLSQNFSIPHYSLTANIEAVDIDECQEVYPDVVENRTLCMKFDGTNRPENTSYALRGSLAVVDGKILVGLLLNERDLSEETDDVQMYTDVHSHVDFISKAVNNVTKNMHYCINKLSHDNETNGTVWRCEDSWE